MKIALCLITKGDAELDNLKKAVKSAIIAVDSVHITANHDHELTKKWCDEKGYDFSYLPWSDDFSAQRNFNFDRVPKGTDWILWMDSDDVIVGAELIRAIAQKSHEAGMEAVFFEYWYSCTFKGKPNRYNISTIDITQERERLLKVGSFVWKKRLHETPVPKDGNKSKYTLVPYTDSDPIVWIHMSADRYQSDNAERATRNRRILELDLADERANGEADPRTLLYLMKVYGESNDLDEKKKLVDMGKEYLTKSGWDQERGTCCRLMSVAYSELGDHIQAIKYAHRAIEEYPQEVVSYLYLSRAYYNADDYRKSEHWLNVALKMEMQQHSAPPSNILELKVVSTQLLLKLNYHYKKNIRKAWEYAKILAELDPTEQHINLEMALFDQKELDKACENVDKLTNYYIDIGREDLIPKTLVSLPNSMQKLPFVIKKYNKYKEPKTWGEDEICYFANFHGDHFEKWGSFSLNKGIGGSETAVIRLAQEWAKKGYKITIYGDPPEAIQEPGITWLPWYSFNPRDHFNIFIQWRNNSLAGKINCKKYLVDLHDVWSDHSYKDKQHRYDKIMCKSNFHTEFGKDISKDKYAVISNGIDI